MALILFSLVVHSLLTAAAAFVATVPFVESRQKRVTLSIGASILTGGCLFMYKSAASVLAISTNHPTIALFSCILLSVAFGFVWKSRYFSILLLIALLSLVIAVIAGEFAFFASISVLLIVPPLIAGVFVAQAARGKQRERVLVIVLALAVVAAFCFPIYFSVTDDLNASREGFDTATVLYAFCSVGLLVMFWLLTSGRRPFPSRNVQEL